MNAHHQERVDEVDGARVIPIRPGDPGPDASGMPDTSASAPPRSGRHPVERAVASGLAFLRRRITGDYEVDEFGFDPELNANVLLPMARALYERWFRVELVGLENVPAEGGALLVSNHSGTVPLDGIMLSVATHDHLHRPLRLLGADLVYQVPVLAHLARKAGHTLACPADAARLLGKGELVGVFPEGFKGIGKPYADRYKLQRFGRGGFVETALRADVPIIPTAVVGAEEIYPKIADLKPLARLLGLPYFPITPTFPLLGAAGLVPLPSKWVIRFGEPMPLSEYGPEAADDPLTVFNLTDHVRETVQQMLYETLLRRGHPFL
ncbi:lysophospholipid acyltransferase family protein [Actinomadura rupiterrae]|uniref:lysophospholipid acyltransferase family protein n=1 Tax=Actinomadura rupiterrae TaxID=559627 RepID=UPI0027E33E8E|nr:lysophospholipid acyltransferase family protein [Actinomadura rupiterrae]MCP2343493.1 1-acyl-sn-glycerol-3-phosphate acyltransferase [Actinomadura rupiterrae]